MPEYQTLYYCKHFNVYKGCDWKFYSTRVLSYCTNKKKVVYRITQQERDTR
jgi:hypothetical protein